MFSYAVKSFRRQTGRYIRIVCILAFAMITPILLSIIGSSSIYGEQKQNLSLSKGMDYRIDNTTPELIERFINDNHFDVLVERNSIYLHYIPDSSPSTKRNNIESVWSGSDASIAIHDILTESNLSALQVYDLTGINQPDSHTTNFMNQIHLVSLIIIFVSVLIFYTGYKAHIHSFSDEIGLLYSIGCSYHKIRVFFFWTLTICYMCAYTVAILFSVISMRILYTKFLNVQSNGYAWMLFHVDWSSIFLLGIMWYILLLIQYFFQMRAHQKNITDTKTTSYRRIRGFSSYGITALPTELLWNRYGQIIHHNILLSALTVIVSIFIINYASINSESLGETTIGDFTISHHQIVANLETGLSEDVKQAIEEIPDIQINYQKEISTTQYLVAAPHQHSKNSVFESGNNEYIQTAILLNPNVQEIKSNSEDVAIPVWLNKYQPDSHWGIGDIIDLYVYDPMSMINQTIPSEYIYDHPFLTEKINLRVCGYVDEKYMDTPLRLFFQASDYNVLTKRYPIVSATIMLNEKVNRNIVKTQLFTVLEKYPDYELVDLSEKQQIAARGRIGIYLIALFITVLFLIVISLVIGIQYSEFVIQQESTNKLLLLMGLSMDNLKHTYRAISYKAYIITLLIGITFAVFASAIFFSDTGYTMSFTTANIIIYSILLIVLYLIMLVPMQIELNRQFKKHEVT